VGRIAIEYRNDDLRQSRGLGIAEKFIELVFAAFADEPDQRSTEFLPPRGGENMDAQNSKFCWSGSKSTRLAAFPTSSMIVGVISAARPTAARSAASGRDLEAPNSRMMSATEAVASNAMQPS